MEKSMAGAQPASGSAISALSTSAPRRVRRGLPAALAFVASLTVASGQASAAGHEERILDTASVALFHLDVTGRLAKDGPDGDEEQRHGKAFAIAPNILLTSSHVIGEYDEWLRLDERTLDGRRLNDAIRRAARPIHRTLLVTGEQELIDGTNEIIAHPAPFTAVDAASLTIPRDEMVLDSVFSLSLCPIDPGQVYSALMTTEADPTRPQSVDVGSLKLFDLTPVGYDPVQFGGLYAFTVENHAPKARFAQWGHSGSPIFDADGNVAAFVSAFLRFDGADTILATPIQPIIPGTTRLLAESPGSSYKGGDLKCSLASTVKEINDDLTSHADWSILVPRGSDGKVDGPIELAYRSVSARPNVDSINVEFYFTGKSRADARRETDFPPSRAVDFQEPIPPEAEDERSFELGQLFIEGKKIEDDPDLRAGRGFISRVDLFITPILKDGREGRPAEFSFPWVVEAD